jgi:hypothetical protein
MPDVRQYILRVLLMRAVLLQIAGRPANLVEFLRRVGQPSGPAEELATGLWLLPLPDCQNWLKAATARLGQTRGLSAKMLLVEEYLPWQILS